jgi:hypothetical protein
VGTRVVGFVLTRRKQPEETRGPATWSAKSSIAVYGLGFGQDSSFSKGLDLIRTKCEHAVWSRSNRARLQTALGEAERRLAIAMRSEWPIMGVGEDFQKFRDNYNITSADFVDFVSVQAHHASTEHRFLDYGFRYRT